MPSVRWVPSVIFAFVSVISTHDAPCLFNLKFCGHEHFGPSGVLWQRWAQDSVVSLHGTLQSGIHITMWAVGWRKKCLISVTERIESLQTPSSDPSGQSHATLHTLSYVKHSPLEQLNMFAGQFDMALLPFTALPQDRSTFWSLPVENC